MPWSHLGHHPSVCSEGLTQEHEVVVPAGAAGLIIMTLRVFI
jgi:hypothetical protein